jgi:hypothetical protein
MRCLTGSQRACRGRRPTLVDTSIKIALRRYAARSTNYC